MSGGGDIHVLRQDSGQESPRMPAWKREILERRKAKGGVSAGNPAPETSPGGAAGSHHVNGDVTGNVNGNGGGSARRDGGASGVSGRNYTITTASQHFANNKEPRAAAAERTAPRESLVLQESLGPLEENPFIKLEKERRKRQDRENAARPVQHILELYGSVPGIRTIRAENIIIIESDPDYFPEAGESKSWQQNGVDTYSSLNDLLDRRGSAVTEIRAKEVVIYDTTLSRSEENLSTLGRPDPDGPRDTGEGQGRVSRILQKFDCNYGKLQKKSHSTENLLDLDCSASARPRHWAKPQPVLVPKPRPSPSVSSQPTSPVFQTPWTSKAKPQPEHHPGSPQPVSSFRQRFEGGVVPKDEPDRGQSKPTRERDWEASEVPPKPKVPCSPETRRVRAESSSLPVSSKVLRTSSEFEIRPSPKPDIDQIPDGDIQARALANLRLQSKNSFTVVPKRNLQDSTAAISPGPPSPTKSSPLPGVPTPPHSPMKKKEEKVQKKKEPEVPPSPSSPPVVTSPASPVSPTPKQPPVDKLPVTNIDDIEVEPPQRVPVPSPMVQRKKGNTFTVVPKRSAEPQKSPPEPQQEAPAEAPPGSTPPQPQYAQLGSLLKKRYPAVEEIQVIGGYLSLAKSCLSKTGSVGKKLKISFNESSLQSTYEYPSESSVWDSGEEDEDDKRDGTPADEQPSMVGRFHIPRPGLVGSPVHSENGNDLSSYIPKHSVDFNTWQENKQEDKVYQEEPTSPQVTEEVMLTPADSSSLSDYSSEPALYF
ncbi:taperin [Poecilia latipinna]|uniref:taperin n=1 Tax=Poecilia latipinna TaxID=48699 RepID=UPI00072DF1C0|nr:PREDICTED: taperin [Poecilia latipinna]